MENRSRYVFYWMLAKNPRFVAGHRGAASFTIASDARRRCCIKYDSRGDAPRSVLVRQTLCLSAPAICIAEILIPIRD